MIATLQFTLVAAASAIAGRDGTVKSEIRISKPGCRCRFGHFDFGYFDLFRILDFGFRIWRPMGSLPTSGKVKDRLQCSLQRRFA